MAEAMMEAGGRPPDRRTSTAKAPPLFQAMLPLEKEDGVVTVHAPDGQVEITVVQGRVISVVHERTSPAEVVALLRRVGVLTSEDVDRAVTRFRDRTADDAVRAAGLVGEATLANAREYLCHEVLMDLLLRTDIRVDGHSTPRGLTREMCGLPVRFLLREAQRRATEIPEVRKVVPSDDLVFARIPVITGQGPVRRWADLPLSPAERQVLLVLDGERSIAEVARICGQSPFKVARAVKGLLEMGLVREVSPEMREPGDGPRLRQRRRARVVRFAAMALLLAALVRAVLTWAAQNGLVQGPLDVWSQVAHHEMARGFVQAARAYRLVHGRPPASAEELVRDGWWF